MAGIGTRKLTISIDGDEVAPEVTSAVIASAAADSDTTTFADAAGGGSRKYTLKITGVQDATAGSLWDQTFSHAGEEVDVIVRPYGNASASPTQPHLEATAIVSEPDGDWIGGEANASNTSKFTFEVEWELTGKPVRVTE